MPGGFLNPLFCSFFESKLFFKCVNDISTELGSVPAGKNTCIDCFPATIREFDFSVSFDVPVISVPGAQEF